MFVFNWRDVSECGRLLLRPLRETQSPDVYNHIVSSVDYCLPTPILYALHGMSSDLFESSFISLSFAAN